MRGANPYHYQSSLCRAAVHAGAVGAEGGQIVVNPEKAPFFPAVTATASRPVPGARAWASTSPPRRAARR